MSIAKVTTIEKSRKDQGECGNCHKPLPAGTGYRYWMPYFRSNIKKVRCLDSACTPAYSELESGKASAIYAAQEAFEANVNDLSTKEDIESAVQEVADAVSEVAEEYRTAADAWEHGNEQLEEKADHYESQHSEIDSWEFDGADEWDRCEVHEDNDTDRDSEEVDACDDCQLSKEEWLEEIREAAREKVNELEIL